MLDLNAILSTIEFKEAAELKNMYVKCRFALAQSELTIEKLRFENMNLIAENETESFQSTGQISEYSTMLSELTVASLKTLIRGYINTAPKKMRKDKLMILAEILCIAGKKESGWRDQISEAVEAGAKVSDELWKLNASDLEDWIEETEEGCDELSEEDDDDEDEIEVLTKEELDNMTLSELKTHAWNYAEGKEINHLSKDALKKLILTEERK